MKPSRSNPSHRRFKTPTFFATYKKRDVFVKLVDRGSAEFALWCHCKRKELGLYTKKTHVFRNTKMTFDYLEMAPETYTLAERNINALIRDNQGVVDVLMVDQVENGLSLCEAIKQGAPIDLLELMKILLFRRHVQSTDTNSSNIVVSPDGRCLSVDENQVTSKTLERWETLGNPKTVFTAQKNANFPGSFLTSLKRFVSENERPLMEFLVKMRDTVEGDLDWNLSVSEVLTCL